AAGINYYRLKLTDKDGRSAYSHVQVVRINSGSSVVIYPNPIFGGDLTVQMPSGPIRSIQAYDARGTMVVNISALPNSATRINTDRWTKGLYTLVTRENGHIIRTEKVIRK
ncbi:MAG TPA: T9SS type A sorting domain-containing protein, partial [Chryseolinea sp.]|nr:T9SS type A sorting domain-containing protein [Chryseolinea sp.]